MKKILEKMKAGILEIGGDGRIVSIGKISVRTRVSFLSRNSIVTRSCLRSSQINTMG